ncbi:hypothetical protein RUM44_002211 [Polyplax serrata]|uniref:Uncharacterized protein n=1 Tax=Polyplax serrata TaxID=468196 RepID=A0ABR1AM88_POLSC
MLELEVIPERSLGCDQWEFILGMHFSQAVAIIQSQVGIIKGVQVLYSDTNPLSADLVINLSCDGVRLIFDSVSQRLKMIEVYNMKLIVLKYSGIIFNSPEVVPSLEQIEHSFGATHPGVYDQDKQIFQLNFRGLSFSFPVESKFEPGYAHGLGSLQLQNGSSPTVSKTSIYAGINIVDCRTPAMPICCYNGHVYLEHAEIVRERNRTKGLKLHLFTEGSCRYTEGKKQCLAREVMLGESCQDVVTSLGAPSRMFYKSEDKMKIHSPNPHKRVTRKSDYFYNYFTLGLDILFDASSQKAKKFVLHTNYPGHYNFNMYYRCEFRIDLHNSEPSFRCDGNTRPQDDPPPPGGNQRGKKGKKAEQKFPEELRITAYTKWKEMFHLVKKSDRPVVLNRASSTNTTNPFGSTFCYPFQDMIFEIMPNEHIASVTIYTPETKHQEV